MSALVVYAGSGLSGIDGKGRTTIPAELRDSIQISSGANEVHLARHTSLPCLIGFGSAEREKRLVDIQMKWQASLAGEELDRETAGLGASSIYKMPFEASGRFVINPILAHFGGFKPEGRCFFFGVTTHFMLWNPDVFLAEAPARFDAVKEELDYWLNIHGKRGK